MRTEENLNLTGAGASLTGTVSGETQNLASFSTQPLTVIGHRGFGSFPRGDELGGDELGGAGPDQWKVDEHWTAVTAYLADLYLPNEG